MAIPKQTEDTERELAEKVVTSMSRGDLEQAIFEDLLSHYKHCPDVFEEDWQQFMEVSDG
jgi:hypothetical protein